MGRRPKSPESEPRRTRPATTPKARENEMISLAMDVAEDQMRSGTASAQVITHFLKLGTEKYRLERAKMEQETELIKAKRDAIDAGQEYKDKFDEVIRAMQRYSGQSTEEIIDDDEDVR